MPAACPYRLMMEHADYEAGISCPHCKPTLDPTPSARFAERQKQIELAAKRGKAHLGVNPRSQADK